MKKRNLIIGSVLTSGLIALAAAGAVSAGPGGDCRHGSGGHPASFEDHGMGRGGPLRHLMKGLDLTEDQRDQIFEIMHEQRPAARDKMKELRKGREALHQLVMSEDYDPQKVRKLADAQSRLMAEMMVMRAETFHKVYGLLTPEQKEKAADLKRQRHEGRGW